MALFDNLFGKKLISPIPIPKEEPNWKQWLNLFLPKNKPENVKGIQDQNLFSTPTPTPTPEWEPIKKSMEKGWQNWNNPPASAYTQIMAEESLKYPILKKYPFLLPAISILETSGGKNITYPNNLLNWGIIPQKKGQFTPKSFEEVISKAASGIGERMPYYKEFRETGNLEDLAEVYAPIEQNPETGGKIYAQRLKDIMDVFTNL